jgi:hypothetical protein
MESNKELSVGQTLKALRRASLLAPAHSMGGRKDSFMNRRTSGIEEISLEETIHHQIKGKMPPNNVGNDNHSLSEKTPSGLGVSKLRYRFITPEEFSDDEELEVCDILNAFRDVTTAHGVPHIGNAKGLLQ